MWSTAECLHRAGDQVFDPIDATDSGIKYQLQLKAGEVLKQDPFESSHFGRDCSLQMTPVKSFWTNLHRVDMVAKRIIPDDSVLFSSYACILIHYLYKQLFHIPSALSSPLYVAAIAWDVASCTCGGDGEGGAEVKPQFQQ